MLSVLLAALLHPSFWEFMIGKPNNRPLMYVIIFFTVLLLKKVVILRYLAGSYLSDGHRVHHPAAWLAFQVILSITFLATGFLVVVWRLFFMVATTIFAIGKIDVSAWGAPLHGTAAGRRAMRCTVLCCCTLRPQPA